MRSRFRESPGRRRTVPPGFDPDGGRHDYLDGFRTALTTRHDLQVADDPPMFRMSRVTESPDRLLVENDQMTHAV